MAASMDQPQPNWEKLQGKLYGRRRQIEVLSQAFFDKISAQQRGLVLISAAAGTGKTSLALTLSHETKFFIHGKFDQLQNPSPYYVLVQAVSDFVRENGEAREVASIRMAAQSVLDPAEIAILLDSIPELEIIFGAFSEVKPTQITRQNGFVFAFCKFIGSLCTGDHPLVLFLDDLQWSDAGSLEILKALTRDPAIQEGLFLLACVRGNEVGMDDPLSLMLRSLDEDDIPIIEIRVPNLSQETIRELISELIDVAEAENENLASFVHEFTRGNAFFVIQFLRSLFEEQLVTRKDGYWVWNEFSITQLFPRNDIIEFLKVKLEKCSSEMQELLKIVSCLGTEIEVNLISYLVSKEETETLLDEAIGKELLSRHNSCVYFTHDCIQLAALSLIAPENKAEFHLFLGQQLFVRMDPEEIQQNLFLVTNQLCLGSSAMYDPEEKNSLAELCLRAGKRASKVSSFDTAAIYLDIGINMLGNRRWRDEYDLSLDLYGSMAEVACSQGDYARVDELLQEILENSRSLHEKLRALTIQVYSLGSRNEHQEAIDKGVEVLKLLGLKFPKKSRMIHILMSMMKTKRMLRGRSDEQILSMPIIQCEDRLAALRLLNIVFLYAFMSRPTFSPLITMTSVQLSIRYGLSDMLCTAMGNYAVLLCVVGDVDAGLRYSELSLKLLARFDAKQWLGRVYCSAYAIVYPWKHPLRGSLMPLKRAQRSALATGDIEYSMISATMYSAVAFLSGLPLTDLLPEMEQFYGLMEFRKQRGVMNLFCPYRQVCLNFIGDADDPLVLTGKAMNEEKALHEAVESGTQTSLLTIYLLKAMIAVYMNRPKEGSKCFERLRRCDQTALAGFGIHLQAFLEGVMEVELARNRSKRRLAHARKYLKILTKFSQRSPSLRHRRLIVEAEIATLTKGIASALNIFDKAIDAAEAEGTLNECALACELAGRACLHHGVKSAASEYYARALAGYERWGSRLKTDHLKELLFTS